MGFLLLTCSHCLVMSWVIRSGEFPMLPFPELPFPELQANCFSFGGTTRLQDPIPVMIIIIKRHLVNKNGTLCEQKVKYHNYQCRFHVRGVYIRRVERYLNGFKNLVLQLFQCM